MNEHQKAVENLFAEIASWEKAKKRFHSQLNRLFLIATAFAFLAGFAVGLFVNFNGATP